MEPMIADHAATAASGASRIRSAQAACSELAGVRLESRESVAAVLSTLAAHDLFRWQFLQDRQFAAGEAGELAAVLQALSSHSNSIATVFMINAIFGAGFVSFFGDDRQRSEILPAIVQGRCQTAFGLTEPQAGSDAAALTTCCERRGERLLLRGEKLFTTGAATADLMLVVARDASAAAHGRAVSVILVAPGARGVTIEPLTTVAQTGHSPCRVRLDDVELAAGAILGGDAGWSAAWPWLRSMGNLERFAVAAIALGLASAALQRAQSHALQREQFGQPIAAFQALQFALVEMHTTVTLMRHLVADAAAAIESGEDAALAASTAKYYCAEQLQSLVGNAMRIMGGRAFFDFEPMSRVYREAPWCLYAGGTSEIQKLLVARSLGLAK